MRDDETHIQVANQCKVVAHLATAIAGVFSDYEAMFRDNAAPLLIAQVGERSARLMETLGDILNGMDAATEEDEWTSPIFEEARRRWPAKRND